jgi:ABC-2 type transport system permease protein
MNAPAEATPPVIKPAPPARVVLRQLFLKLFLRGRSARGLRKSTAPQSIGSKLSLTLFFYALFGLMAASAATGQSLFTLSLFLHSSTVIFLGMFVASSAGEVLFNKEEADILLHRPVAPRTMLWAKVRVLVEVSLWLAGAFNLAGLIAGAVRANGSWRFPVAHALSTIFEALFCTGGVVVAYQLCLRWFGRERLDGLMTTVQVVFAIAIVVGGQLPNILMRVHGSIHLNLQAWWVSLLPTAWFAGFDDALAGSGARGSWALGGLGLAATAGVLWMAFGKLAEDYEGGLQRMGEVTSAPKPLRGGRRWVDVLVSAPPLRWWLRDSVSRASFLLVTAYLVRDRDVKLRIYPGLAPVMVMPLIFLFQPGNLHAADYGKDFGVAFSGAYLGLVPMMALNLLQYSQQWQASDVFRVAPVPGPAALYDGARRAVLCFLTLPMLVMLGLITRLLHQDSSSLLLLLPGILALPVYSMVPCLMGDAVPLSKPTEEAKSTSRGIKFIGVVMISLALSALADFAWNIGWFWWFLLAELIAVVIVYAGMRAAFVRLEWSPVE